MADQKITTFLTYESQAEEAVKLYTSVFPDSKIVSENRYPTDVGPVPKGTLMTAEFELFGRRYVALNGGPSFKFSEAISLCVNCDTQEEVDEYWERLSEGGQKGPCGWLTDRFGVSWQIVPKLLSRLLSDPDQAKAKRVMDAMLQMGKLEIKALQDAYDKA